MSEPLDRRCGYAVVDHHGEEGPCDRLAASWRWYQDAEHEDLLDVACDLHENEGGRRLHAAETELATMRERVTAALQAEEDAADAEQRLALAHPRHSSRWTAHMHRVDAVRKSLDRLRAILACEGAADPSPPCDCPPWPGLVAWAEGGEADCGNHGERASDPFPVHDGLCVDHRHPVTEPCPREAPADQPGPHEEH